MSQKAFMVYTPGRTGSTLIVANLNYYFNTDVSQVHRPAFKPDHGDYTCILSRRGNTFEAVLSQLVLERTKESHSYTNQAVEPFVADARKFMSLYMVYENFYKNIDLRCFKKVVEIWYEPLIADPYYLFSQFNIVEQTKYKFDHTIPSVKSPYNYYNLIVNIDELKDLEYQHRMRGQL